MSTHSKGRNRGAGNQQQNNVDWEGAYEVLEPEDRAVIEEWADQFSCKGIYSGKTCVKRVLIPSLGEKGGRELAMKLAMLIIKQDPEMRGRP